MNLFSQTVFIGLLFSEKPKKTRADQSTLQMFYFVIKEDKPSATAKKLFLQSVCYW